MTIISKMIIIILILLSCFSSRSNSVVASSSKDEEDLISMGEELQTLSKPSVKTIQLDGGDIVDCIDFYKQPAFDHPLLKDHKILKLPQSYLARRMKQIEASRSTDEACPIGTVPIRRTTKEILMTPRSAHNHRASTVAADSSNGHLVLVHMQRLQVRRYRGASGFASVHNFTVTTNQFSSTMIWAENGDNYITAGWMVGLFIGDSNPRLMIYWTADGGHQTGCYNMFCRGFVQVDRQISTGHVLKQVSSYGGPIYDVKIKISQDKQTGNWVFSAFKEDIIIGYLPRELMPLLKDGAKSIAWGGEAFAGRDGMSPPMGNGHKPDGKYDHSAYFKNLVYFAQNYIRRWPSVYNTGYRIDGSGCYGLQNGTDVGKPRQFSFLFGGPGGHCPN